MSHLTSESAFDLHTVSTDEAIREIRSVEAVYVYHDTLHSWFKVAKNEAISALKNRVILEDDTDTLRISVDSMAVWIY